MGSYLISRSFPRYLVYLMVFLLKTWKRGKTRKMREFNCPNRNRAELNEDFCPPGL